MRPSLSILSFVLILIGFSCTSQSVNRDESEVSKKPADQEDFQDAHEINRLIGKGINLGNALEAPEEGDWGMTIQEEYLDLISDAGFESVRIPIRWNAHADTAAPFVIHESFFERVDEIVNWALERDLTVVLNIHHYNELMENPAQHRERFLAIWSQIASHYNNYPETVLFELLNEPHDNLTPTLWNEYLAGAIEVIRQTNPQRILIVGTAPWGGIDGLQHLELPENERRVIVTVHYYDPFRFTHQGAEWVGPEADDWLGTEWSGSDEEKNAIDEKFAQVVSWAEEQQRPVYLGEFGAFQTADDESRKRWTTYVRKSAEQRNFSWAYWEFGAGFGVYDRNQEQWRDPLLQALISDSLKL